MLSETATITDIDDDRVVLRTRRQPSCSGCSLKAGCGQYLLGKDDDQLILARGDSACLARDHGLKTGDRVKLTVAPGQLLALACWFYVLPLATLIAGTLVAQLSGAADGAVMASAGAGLFAGLWFSRRFLAVAGKRFKLDPERQGANGDSGLATPLAAHAVPDKRG